MIVENRTCAVSQVGIQDNIGAERDLLAQKNTKINLIGASVSLLESSDWATGRVAEELWFDSPRHLGA
jgi:hypothetical protein